MIVNDDRKIGAVAPDIPKCPECKNFDVHIINYNPEFKYKCRACGKLFNDEEDNKEWNEILNEYFDSLNILEQFSDGDIIDSPKTTQEKIEILCDNFKTFLIEKNIRYGDSALNPKKIFSKVNVESQICNRLDDKLSCIERSEKLQKNDVCDSLGYHMFLMIENDWLTFNDLLD